MRPRSRDRRRHHRLLAVVIGLVATVAVACGPTSDPRPHTQSGQDAPAMPGTVPGTHAAPDTGPQAQQQEQAPREAAPVPWTPGVWQPPPPDLEPAGMWIPEIDVAAPTHRLGLNDDGTLQVPGDWDAAGWYEGRSRPGEPGPAVVAGHVDSRSGPAVFHRLGELSRGDLVHMVYEDGLVETFVVTGSERHPKDAFPTDRVYGPTEAPTLRLITCAGEFDRGAGSYEENLIVYGEIHATWRYDPAGA